MEATTLVYSLMGIGFVTFCGETFSRILGKPEWGFYIKIAGSLGGFIIVLTAAGTAIQKMFDISHQLVR